MRLSNDYYLGLVIAAENREVPKACRNLGHPLPPLGSFVIEIPSCGKRTRDTLTAWHRPRCADGRLQNVSKTPVEYGGLAGTAADDEKLVSSWDSNP